MSAALPDELTTIRILPESVKVLSTDDLFDIPYLTDEELVDAVDGLIEHGLLILGNHVVLVAQGNRNFNEVGLDAQLLLLAVAGDSNFQVDFRERWALRHSAQ